jgi:hypothetical protein
VALSKRWHNLESLETTTKFSAGGSSSGLSGTCHLVRMYTHLCATVPAPRKFDRGTAQALLRDARALRPTLRSHFTVYNEPALGGYEHGKSHEFAAKPLRRGLGTMALRYRS